MQQLTNTSDCDKIGGVKDYMATWPSAKCGRPFLVQKKQEVNLWSVSSISA